MSSEPRRWRLFLDTGVIIAGTTQPWGAARAVVILATQRQRFTVVLSDVIEREVARVLARKLAALAEAERDQMNEVVLGWFKRVRLERRPSPSADAIRAAMPRILPALRHLNDLPAVVAAMEAGPDWVISANEEHWNERVAQATGLHIVTPYTWLSQFSPPVMPPRQQ